ncbi:hypothetical protein [Sanguibacter inulinus]|jgi:hypothetical protein|uniref:Uncharacterized protein n=1 Tax=Sanguibacter inulinus TaxID=60922 RepID=A0A853F169_9MICO|nr:hypothetical protein [Sanguibacter inulinus]MBF0724078.1 hypothetical protein [Sanguibacter inulinus]NYS95223.1 hypothetical protein [Sanguibacter inulinus]
MPVTSWGPSAELNPGDEGASLIEFILSRRERVPAYQATGISGTGEDAEITVGQVWPR